MFNKNKSLKWLALILGSDISSIFIIKHQMLHLFISTHYIVYQLPSSFDVTFVFVKFICYIFPLEFSFD